MKTGDATSHKGMGNNESTDSNEVPVEPTGPTLSENSPGHTPIKHRRTTDTKKMSDEGKAKTSQEVSEAGSWAASGKASSELDDDFFEKFCGEIDHVLEGHHEALQPLQQTKKLTPTAAEKIFPDKAHLIRQSGPLIEPGVNQQEHEKQRYPETGRYLQREHHFKPQPHQHHTGMLPHPPKLDKRTSEKPVSIWKRPEDLAHREKLLRERFEDTWFPTWAELEASRKESMERMRQCSDLEANQRDNDLDDPILQDKEGFDVSKFKAANKKRYGQRVERLLPATYKGYNASLSRQGTVPSLHRASVSSTLSGSGISTSDKPGPSHLPVRNEPTYNHSEEALLDYIEKEFS